MKYPRFIRQGFPARPLSGRALLCALGALVVLGLTPLSEPLVGTARAQGVIDRNHVPGTERVDPFERRRDNIDANNVRATITNWAQSGNSGTPGDFWYEWPKNTGRRYVALTQLWVGAEVEDENNDTLWVVNVADFRSNPVNDNISWTFEPVKGYVNPAGAEYGIAQSDELTSWPSAWPDKLADMQDPGWSNSWNGFFGKDVFNADQEFFYKIGDDQYDRYSTYFPDSTDLSRRGMGLVAEVRVLAWSQILIQDVVFFIHGAKNDGTRDIRKTGMSMWLADCVGGDCGDDIPYFDLLEDVAFMTDLDGVGNEFFGADPVGVATFAFLESPGNAEDRIDNDGDGSTSDTCNPVIGECNSPVIPGSFLQGENPTNALDDNGNGLIDENQTHVPFITPSGIPQTGVGYADYIDNDGDGEPGSPVVTEAMAALATTDHWRRWPPVLATDQDVTVHLVGVEEDDVGRAFKDRIDNDDTHLEEGNYLAEPGSPTVTQEMVDAAASDSYRRYRVPGTDIVLYDVGPEDIGKAYADGVDNDGDGATDEGIDEEIDEMIDESRADGIDNDKDWNRFLNDTGLDGVPFNGDPGDNDAMPTSGAGTGFPGERNIDVTDISESDQIGITNVRIFGAGTLGIGSSSDRFLFRRFMLPGNFDTALPEPGDTDITVSSGIFPLKAGQTERISLAVVMGGTAGGGAPVEGLCLAGVPRRLPVCPGPHYAHTSRRARRRQGNPLLGFDFGAVLRPVSCGSWSRSVRLRGVSHLSFHRSRLSRSADHYRRVRQPASAQADRTIRSHRRVRGIPPRGYQRHPVLSGRQSREPGRREQRAGPPFRGRRGDERHHLLLRRGGL